MELQGYDLRYLITSLVGRGVTTTHRPAARSSRARQVEQALRTGSTAIGDAPLPTWLDLLPDDDAWDVVSRRRDAA